MLGSLEEMDEDAPERKEEKYFRPEIVCVHSQATGDSCPRCPTGEEKPEDQPETVQNAAYPENQVYLLPPGTDPSEAGSERDPLSLDEGEEAVRGREKAVKEREDNGDTSPKKAATAAAPDTDMNNKKRFMFRLEGLKEGSGLLYIGCDCDKEKTSPSQIMEWFNTEFLNLHRVYAIREEEPFLLRLFTRNHESSNKGHRRKGGRKVMLMGKEVFGDVMLACGHCGYWSHEGSNVRRHLKNSVCLKDRGYSRKELEGLDKVERRRFLRRVASAKCRAKKRAKVLGEEAVTRLLEGISSAETATTTTTGTATSGNTSYSPTDTHEPYAECIVEIEEQGSAGESEREEPAAPVSRKKRRGPKKPIHYRALTLGPAVVEEAVPRVPFDVYTVSSDNDRVAWKPPSCHKAHPGDRVCRIVFKGARMKRRCLDLPLPKVLIYRKLDCKTHHCNFTHLHPSARAAFQKDDTAKASINLKAYGGIVMTHEFYHYFVSLLSIKKMKTCQAARHLTNVWGMILSERLGTSTIPEDHRTIITLSKQTVKSIWNNIEDERGFRIQGSRRRKKPPLVVPSVSNSMPPPPPPPPPLPVPPPSTVNHYSSTVNTVDVCGVVQPSLAHPCMKRLNNYIPIKPAPPPPTTTTHPPPSAHTLPGPHKPSMMPPPPPPHPSHHNAMQQAAPHTHWLGQTPQYPHNMAPYPMAPPPPPAAEYYTMPGHFVTQYTPAPMGTSP